MHLSTPECPNGKWKNLKTFCSKQLGNIALYRCAVFSPLQHTSTLPCSTNWVWSEGAAFCGSVL